MGVRSTLGAEDYSLQDEDVEAEKKEDVLCENVEILRFSVHQIKEFLENASENDFREAYKSHLDMEYDLEDSLDVSFQKYMDSLIRRIAQERNISLEAISN